MSRQAALVVVPTHDHATTLSSAVHSALEQSVADLTVVIIGDGVGDDTREVANELCRTDDRVSFLDRTKTLSRNEAARHEVVSASTAPVITYLGDDDLFLPDHVETMQSLLVEHDFAHPYPVFIERTRGMVVVPTDLSQPDCVQWHLVDGCNAIALTGATHTRELYRRLPFGWRPPPPGHWSDHYMWRQIFAVPGVRLVTCPRSTTIKLPAVDRPSMTPQDRRDEIESWSDRSRATDFRVQWDREVESAIRGVATERFLRADELARKLDADYALFLEECAWLSQKLAEVQIAFAAERDDLLQQVRGH